MLLLIDIKKVLLDLSYFNSRQIWLALLFFTRYLCYFKNNICIIIKVYMFRSEHAYEITYSCTRFFLGFARTCVMFVWNPSTNKTKIT